MIKPTCQRCKAELTKFGAIVLSPPVEKESPQAPDKVGKYHICVTCWDILERWLEGKSDLVS